METGGQGARCTPVESKLDCAICLERYRRPKLLPCFHTFCQACLQTLAGTSPCFPCPACRTPVIVPPGGLAALQTNFYIEGDLDNKPSHKKLCDVCVDEREATYKCLQCNQRYCGPCRQGHDSYTVCRFHNIISLQMNTKDAEDLKGKSAKVPVQEEKCVKHPKHELILYCNTCSVNICLQCKLTSHDGHPTSDLEETGAEVKAKLRSTLEDIGQHVILLEGVLAMADLECTRLQEQGRKMEEEMRARGRSLVNWATQAVDNAVASVHTTLQALITGVREHTRHVQDLHAALVAHRDHGTHVLNSDVAVDIVSLVAKLSVPSVVKDEIQQLQDTLKTEASIFTCRHDPTALNLTHLLAFVGVVDKAASSVNKRSSVADQQEPCSARVTGDASSVPALTTSNVLTSKPPPRELIYSRNPASKISTMCPASQSRLWVRFAPSGLAMKMALLSEMDETVETRDDAFVGKTMVTILGNTTVAGHSWRTMSWIQPGGRKGVIKTKGCEMNMISKNAGSGGYVVDIGTDFNYRLHTELHDVTFESIEPLKFKTKVWLCAAPAEYVFDVSYDREYIVCANAKSAQVYRRSKSDGVLNHESSYSPGNGQEVTDACFCVTGGQELLMVAVPDDNSVHVVDHTDGCLFVRRLDTTPLPLVSPQYLATDHDKKVWIGCDGGKVVLVYL